MKSEICESLVHSFAIQVYSTYKVLRPVLFSDTQMQILSTYGVTNKFWFGVKDLHSSVVWTLFFQDPVLP